MKIIFLTNNDISLEVYNYLLGSEEVILIEERLTLEKVKEIEPEFIISYNYKHLIKKDIIDYMKGKIINLHISLLPWNRGASPNLWSFLEDTPKGVTIHLIDEGIDTGNILVQKEVSFNEEKESLKTSYFKLHDEMQQLFKENWNKISTGVVEPKPQIGKGSIHFVKELHELEGIIENWDITIAELKTKYYEVKGEKNGK